MGTARDSGGLLWSVKPRKMYIKKKEKKREVLKFQEEVGTCVPIFLAAFEVISIMQAGSLYLVKWRLDSCTSISLLLKSLSSFLIAACRGQRGRRLSKAAKA